jgi:chromosome segregation ATPase
MNIDPVKALDDKLERLKKDLKSLNTRIDNQQTEAAQQQLSTTNQFRDTTRKVTKTNDRITELAESVHRLERLLVALNRKVRAGETQRADFDTWQEVPSSLIAKILAGQEAYGRKTFTQQEAKNTRKTITEYDKAAHQAIDAAEALTTLPPNAEALWRKKYKQWRAITKQERPIPPDENTHAKDTAAKSAGNEAVAEVRRKIRTRIEDAVARDLLFPAWFENMLGPAAPPGKADDWLYTATDVVLYRLLHDVTSPADALGPPPQEQGHRRSLHDRLIVECADYRKL